MLDIIMKPSKLWLRNPKDIINPLTKTPEDISVIHSPRKDEKTISLSPPPMISCGEELFPPCSRNPSVIRKNTQVCGDSDMVPFKRQESEPLPKKRRLLDVRDHNDNQEEEERKEGSPPREIKHENSEDEIVSSCNENEKRDSELCQDAATVNSKEIQVKCEEDSVLSCENNHKCQESPNPLDSTLDPKMSDEDTSENNEAIKALVTDKAENKNDSNLSNTANTEAYEDLTESGESNRLDSEHEGNINTTDQFLPDKEKSSSREEVEPLTTQSLLTPNPENKHNGEIIPRTNSPSLDKINGTHDSATPSKNSTINSSRKEIETSIDEFQDILAKACHAVGLDEGPMDISDIIEDTNFTYPFNNYEATNPTVNLYHKEHQEMRMPYYPPHINKDPNYQQRNPTVKTNKYLPSMPHFSHSSYINTHNAPLYRNHPPYPPQKQTTRFHFPYRVPYQEQMIPPQAYSYSSEYPLKPQAYPYSDPYYYYRYQQQHANQYQQRPHVQVPHPENQYPWPNENYSNCRMDPKQMHYYYRYPVRPPAVPPTHFSYPDASANFKPCRYESYPSNVRQRNHISFSNKHHPEVPGIPQNISSMNNNTYFPNQSSSQQVPPVRQSISPQEYSVQRSGYSPIRSPITPVVFNNPQTPLVARITTTVNNNTDNKEKTLSSFPIAPVPMKYSEVPDPKTMPPSHKINEHTNNKRIASYENSFAACNAANYETSLRNQGPFVIEKVRQYSYPPGHCNDWKVPTYNSESDNNKNHSHTSNGVGEGVVHCSTKTTNYHNSLNGDSLGSQSNHLTKSTVNDKNVEYRYNQPSYNYPVNYQSQMYSGHDKCPPQPAQFGGAQTSSGSCKIRKLQENRQIIPSKSQAMTSKKKLPAKSNVSSTGSNLTNTITPTSKHDLAVTNASKSYSTYTSSYKGDYSTKFQNSSDNCNNYYPTAQNNHYHGNVANYNEPSSMLYKNNIHNTQEGSVPSHNGISSIPSNNKITNEYLTMPNLISSSSSSLYKSSTLSNMKYIKNSHYQDPTYLCNQNSVEFKKDISKSPELNRNLQSNPGSETYADASRERQDSQEKETKRRSHSLPSDITIGPFILNKGYATFANPSDEDCDMLLFKQKLLPVIDHLLSIPEAANLRPLRDNPDELLDHLVTMWGGKGANSTALDAHQRMKENFVSVVKFLFKPHLLSMWGWDKAPPEQILDELLNTSEQGQYFNQLTFGELGHQNNTLQFPRSSSSMDDDEVFLPSTFTCSDMPEDVFKYFDIIDPITSVSERDFKECSETSDNLKNNLESASFSCKSSCSNNSDSSLQEHRHEDNFSLENSLENCVTLIMENDVPRTEEEIHPNLSSVEDMIPSILEENMIENTEWKEDQVDSRTVSDFDSSPYNVEKMNQDLYLEKKNAKNESVISDSMQDIKYSKNLTEKISASAPMPLTASNGLDRISPFKADNSYVLDGNKMREDETKAENCITEWDKLAEHLIEYKNQFTLNEKNYKTNISNNFDNEKLKGEFFDENVNKNTSKCLVISKSPYSVENQTAEERPRCFVNKGTIDYKEKSIFSQESMDTDENSINEEEMLLTEEMIPAVTEEEIVSAITDEETLSSSSIPTLKIDPEVPNKSTVESEEDNVSNKCDEKLLPVGELENIISPSSEDITNNPDKKSQESTPMSFDLDSNLNSKNDERDSKILNKENENNALESTVPVQMSDNSSAETSNTVLRIAKFDSEISDSGDVDEENKPPGTVKSLSSDKDDAQSKLLESKEQLDQKNVDSTAVRSSSSELKEEDANENVPLNCGQEGENPSTIKSTKCIKDKFKVRKINSSKAITLKRQNPVTDYTTIFQKYVESKMLLAESEVIKTNKGNTGVRYKSA